MTQHTDSGREAFEAWRVEELRKGIGGPVNLKTDDDLRRVFLNRRKSGEYQAQHEQQRYEAWQAARRDPVAQVPQDVIEAARQLHRAVRAKTFDMHHDDALKSMWEQNTKYAVKVLQHIVDAAAPKPPATAPVVLPEHSMSMYASKDDMLAAVLEENERLRAAPVVPQFNPAAKKRLAYLLDAGESITGYAIQNKDGRRGAIDCHGFVYWLHDAAIAAAKGE